MAHCRMYVQNMKHVSATEVLYLIFNRIYIVVSREIVLFVSLE